MKNIFLSQFDFDNQIFTDSTNVNKNLDNDIFIVLYGNIDNLNYLCKKHQISQNNITKDILLEIYKKFNTKIFNLIEGEWTLFIYDSTKKKFYLGRNHIGIYSTYYVYSKGKIIFSNSIQLINNKIKKKKINTKTVHTFLYGGKNNNSTYYEDIYKLPFGVYYEGNNRNLIKKRYWFPENNKNIFYKNEYDYVEHLHEILKKDITKKTYNKVVGSSLSAGLDSTMIFNELLDLNKEKVFAFTQNPNGGSTKQNWVLNEYPLVKKWLSNKSKAKLIEVKGSYSILEANDLIHKISHQPIWSSANIVYVLDYYKLTKNNKVDILYSGFGGNFTTSWCSDGTYLNFQDNFIKYLFFNNFSLYNIVSQIKNKSFKNISFVKSVKDLKRQFLRIGIDDFGFYGNLARYYNIDFSIPLISKEVVDFCLSIPENIYKPKIESRILAKNYISRYTDFNYNNMRGMQVPDILARFNAEKESILKINARINEVDYLKKMQKEHHLFLKKENIWSDLRNFNLFWFLFKNFYL